MSWDRWTWGQLDLCPGTAGPVSWDRWTCVLGPLDLCLGTPRGPVSWDRWTCVLGPLDLCPGTLDLCPGTLDLCPGTAVSECRSVGVSECRSVGVSGVSAVSDMSECRSLTQLTLDRHEARVSTV